MALTPAEKQRAYRERQKQKKEESFRKGDPTSFTYSAPFHEFYGDYVRETDFDLALSLAGIPAPEFEDDRGPEEFVLNGATDGVADPFGGVQGAIGRAEVMIGCLIDAAAALAELVNEYKQQEIKARLAELESSNTTARATAMSEAVKLNKMLDLLDKRVRKDFPQWKVTGV